MERDEGVVEMTRKSRFSFPLMEGERRNTERKLSDKSWGFLDPMFHTSKFKWMRPRLEKDRKRKQSVLSICLINMDNVQWGSHYQHLKGGPVRELFICCQNSTPSLQ